MVIDRFALTGGVALGYLWPRAGVGSGVRATRQRLRRPAQGGTSPAAAAVEMIPAEAYAMATLREGGLGATSTSRTPATLDAGRCWIALSNEKGPR